MSLFIRWVPLDPSSQKLRPRSPWALGPSAPLGKRRPSEGVRTKGSPVCLFVCGAVCGARFKANAESRLKGPGSIGTMLLPG